MKFSCALVVIFSLVSSLAFSQYQPREVFVDNLYQHKGDAIRSASGKPGNRYWQNRADYFVEASFDTVSHRLDGIVTITYTNNSPDELNELWLELDQNLENFDSRVNLLKNKRVEPSRDNGFLFKSIEYYQHGKKQDYNYSVYGTRLLIRLPKAISSGEKIRLKIDYSYVLHERGVDFRSGYLKTKNGTIFEIAYWYPRMCVYDDYFGWNTLPFTGGGEMYLDYGDIDYKITVPSNEVVVGSGNLVNAKKILNIRTLQRLKTAKNSDRPVFIRGLEEVGEKVTKGKSATTTWHFHMKNTRDVAWAMSSAYLWDAAKVNLTNGKKALAQSVYPVESTQDSSAWARSTEMLKFSVEYFSKYVLDFPYKVATSVAGPVGGMEFPALAFNYWKVNGYDMLLLASHEIGHTWFPMIVGSDERRNAFMDEGFNVFVDVQIHDAFNNGEFAPKRDGEYAKGYKYPADAIIPVIESVKNGPTLMTPADNMDYKFVHPLSYFKTAYGLVLLRDVIVGADRFDWAFKNYAKNWAYKHPKPEDFFRSMDNGTGEDLTWFWNEWFYHNWQLDQSVDSVQYQENDPKNGSIISFKNNDKMALPLLVKVIEENGKEHNLHIPVEIWHEKAKATINVPSTTKIKQVIVDPEHQLPDTNRQNNVFPRK